MQNIFAKQNMFLLGKPRRYDENFIEPEKKKLNIIRGDVNLASYNISRK